MRSKKTAVNAILLLVGLVLSSTFGSSGSNSDLKQAGVVALAPLHDNTVQAQSIGQPVPFTMPAAPAPPATVPPLPTSVTVLPGDGFSQLASRLNIPGLDAARLCGANPDLAPPHVLGAGEVLAVPAPDAAVMPCDLSVKPPVREAERVAPSGDQGASPEPVSYESGSIQQIIVDAANEFGVSAQRMLNIADCESGFDPNNSNGSHDGLFQQARAYWDGRVRNFNNAHPDKPLESDNVYNPVSNSRVSAWMMSTSGFGDWECKG